MQTLVCVTGNTNRASPRAHRCKAPVQREEAHDTSGRPGRKKGKTMQPESSPSRDAGWYLIWWQVGAGPAGAGA